MAKLDIINEQELNLSGHLIFITVAAIYKDNESYFRKLKNDIKINLKQVKRVDSSALALLMSWLRFGQEQQCKVEFINIPKQLIDLAKLSSVDKLISKSRDELS